LIPRPRGAGEFGDQAGQGRRAKPILDVWASPRTPVRRRSSGFIRPAGSWNQPSEARAGADRILVFSRGGDEQRYREDIDAEEWQSRFGIPVTQNQV
jgi:hypothetical protein